MRSLTTLDGRLSPRPATAALVALAALLLVAPAAWAGGGRDGGGPPEDATPSAVQTKGKALRVSTRPVRKVPGVTRAAKAATAAKARKAKAARAKARGAKADGRARKAARKAARTKAVAKARKAKARALAYELKASGARVGKATLRLGRYTKQDGVGLARTVAFEASTEGLLREVYRFDADATTLVDAEGLPLKARWRAELPKGPREIRASFDGRKLKAKETRSGALHRRFDQRFATEPLDLLSLFAWLPMQDLAAGTVLKRTLYEGSRLSQLTAKALPEETLALPTGARRVVPVRLKVKRGKKTRTLMMYVDVAQGVPVKLTWLFGRVGLIEAVLVGESVS